MARANKIKGYKVFSPGWTCGGFQYEVGKTYKMKEEPEVGVRGFHFCEKMRDCFVYYPFDSKNKVAEVFALGNIDRSPSDSNACTNKIKIVREIPWDKMLDLVNTGYGNTGIANSGDCNTGKGNVGSFNTGDFNVGWRNAGPFNTGSNNVGYRNAGDFNTGCCNTGNYNQGEFNVGCHNSGGANTGNHNSGKWLGWRGITRLVSRGLRREVCIREWKTIRSIRLKNWGCSAT